MISIEALSKSFSTPQGPREILRNISLDIPAGSFTTIFGPNGCGKSTLVNIIAGLEQPSSGRMNGNKEIKNHLGYVFQDYRRSLLPWGNVEENIIFPLQIRGIGKPAARKILASLLELTGVTLDLRQSVITLSGGQAQTVCLLRALIIEPRLLILDEPFAALDYEKTLALRTFLSEISKRLKLSVLFISHDIDEAVFLGDRVILLSQPPTSIYKILDIPLPFPRTIAMTTTDEYQSLRKQALECFMTCAQLRDASRFL